MKFSSLFLFLSFLLLSFSFSIKLSKSPKSSSPLWQGNVRYFIYTSGTETPSSFISNPLSINNCKDCYYLTVTKTSLFFTKSNQPNRILHNVLKISALSTRSENSNIDPIVDIGNFNEGYCISLLESKIRNNNKSRKWGICLDSEVKKNSLLSILNNILIQDNDNNNSIISDDEYIDPCNDKYLSVLYKGKQSTLKLTRNTITLYRSHTEIFSNTLKHSSFSSTDPKSCCFSINSFSLCGLNTYSINCEEYITNISSEFVYYKTQCDPSYNDILGDMGLPSDEVALREKELLLSILKYKLNK